MGWKKNRLRSKSRFFYPDAARTTASEYRTGGPDAICMHGRCRRRCLHIFVYNIMFVHSIIIWHEIPSKLRLFFVYGFPASRHRVILKAVIQPDDERVKRTWSREFRMS